MPGSPVSGQVPLLAVNRERDQSLPRCLGSPLTAGPGQAGAKTQSQDTALETSETSEPRRADTCQDMQHIDIIFSE